MPFVTQPLASTTTAKRSLALLAALAVLGALAVASVQGERSAFGNSRCRDLVVSERPTSYVDCEAQGCATARRPIPAALK